MENSLLVALSHQGVLRRRLDVVANNMANMNSAGFKAQRLLAEDYPVRGGGAREAIHGYELAFVRDAATVRDMTAGALESTGNPLDLALRGDGWFAIEGDAGERFTRNGSFRLDAEGRLVTADGHAVQGEGGAPIVVDDPEAKIHVASDGTISTQAGEIGRLRIVRFADPQTLDAVAGGLMSSPEMAEEVLEPQVVQGMIESSNVDAISEITRLIDVQRAYQRTSKMIDREDKRIRNMVEAYAR